MTGFQKKILLLVATAIFGGGIPVFSKMVLRELNPAQLMTLRFFGASIIFIALTWRHLPRKINQWFTIGLVALPAAINLALFSQGLLLTTATMASLIYCFGPIAAAVMVWVIGQETVGRRKLWGILIGFSGMLILILAPLEKHSLTQALGSFSGNSLIFVAMLLWTTHTVASKTISRQFSAPVIATIVFLVAFLLNAAIGGFTVFRPQIWLQLSETTWLFLLVLILISSCAYYWLFQLLIQSTSAVTASITTYLSPLITFIWAAILLGETLNWLLVIAGSMTIAGAYLTTTTKNKLWKR